ncbi:MAG TPA: ParA family protein [Desulfobacteraceae bacterium]|mgnify:CR=1 FL=1|nr:ParA family protein [Desulfobacteraceae bacterium]
MSVIAVYNIKGGVGKTATAVNLSYLAAADGEKTLLCDMDPQGSSSYYFRIRSDKKFNAEKLLKGGKHIDRSIRGTDFPNLDLLPADFSYRNMDIALDDMKKSRQRIRRIIKPLRSEYKRVFLDCPPNITLLSENIFHAADCILVPLIPTTLSLLALRQLYGFLDEIGEKRSKVLVFFSMVEKRKKMHWDMMRELIKEKECLPALIPFLADIEKMGLFRRPVNAMLPNSVAAGAYADLWRELKKRLERQ